MTSTALATQVGGSHYKGMAIQPAEFSLVNGLKTAQANIVKYLPRAPLKGGAQDLGKAIHYCDLWLELAETYQLPWASFDSAGRITVDMFVEANRLPDKVASVLHLVCEQPSPVRVAAAKVLIAELLVELTAER